MRITPVILIGLGLWGLFMPEQLSTLDASNGRLFGGAIFLLGCFSLWRFLRRH